MAEAAVDVSFGAARRQLFRMRSLRSSIPEGFGFGERGGASSFYGLE